MNKKNIFLFHNYWIIFHGLIVLALLIGFISGSKYSISTSLFEILPPSNDMHNVSEADTLLSKRTERNLVILSTSQDFNTAKQGAELLEQGLQTCNGIESTSLHFDASTIQELSEFLFTYRYQFLDTDQIKKLSTTEGAQQTAQSALETAYGTFTLTPLDYIYDDPFLLTEQHTQRLLKNTTISGSSLSLKEGVLATQQDDQWYVLLRVVLTPQGASLSNVASGVKQIYDTAATISIPCTFVYSGVLFHSYHSSSTAQKEIQIISIVSMVLVIALLLLLFHSGLPVLLSVLAIIVSALSSLACCLIFFHRIHILTFVFGTTLIGTCLDYSIHFFMYWKFHDKLQSGSHIKDHLLRGLSLSLLSTEICYAILIVSPFPLLKQVGLFSFIGIASSYLTVICLYPLLPLPEQRYTVETVPVIRGFHLPHCLRSVISHRIILGSIAAIACVLLVVNKERITINNNVTTLYTMKGTLLQNEITAAKILDFGTSGWYYIVTGTSQQNLLQHEKQVTDQLDILIQNGEVGSYIATSQFIPTVEQQHSSWQAVGSLMALRNEQMQNLGFTVADVDSVYESYLQAKNQVIDIDASVPQIYEQVLSSIYIGEIKGTWYSAIFPLHTKATQALQNIAKQNPDIYFVNKTQNISQQLNHLTKLLCILLGLAYIIIIVAFRAFYPPKTMITIGCIPPFVVLVTLTVLTLCNIPLGFFSITGIILIFGLGLDYIVYTVENEQKTSNRLTSCAIAVSFITTALSFGALALSTFAPVHIFGITVFTGLVAAYICSLLPVTE